MQTINDMTKNDLKKVIKESMKEAFSEKNLREIISEVIEDFSMGKAIEKGINTETIDNSSFIKKLKSRSKS